MGQNSSFHLGITDVIKQWAQMGPDSSIFINRSTRQHLQRFIVHIPLAELLREVTIYNARIQAVHPSVCRVAYFNQLPNNDERKGFHTFAVYTDHLLPIRQGYWTQIRFVHTLQAVLTLTSYYGFFRLVEPMVRINQRGEIKVWISGAPANNHRDFALNTEEQALAAFVGLAARKNYDVANLLIGCTSLQQAMERLTQPRQKSSFPMENLTQDRQLGRRDYKNVFESGKVDVRSYEANGQSALLSGRKEQVKPFSYGGKHQNVKSGRTTSQYKRAKPGEFFLKRRPQSKQVEETSFDSFSKSAKPPPAFDSIPHFETAGEFTSNFHIPSPTNNKTQSKPAFTPDITIINNNVSHVVNNITHNHSSWNHFRNLRTPEFVADHKKEPGSPNAKKEKVSAPKFIQQRKQQTQSKQNIKSFYANNSEKSSGIINAPKSSIRQVPNFSSTHTSNNTDTQESFKTTQMEWSVPLQQRKPQKLYTFSRPINSKSPPKLFSTSFSPHAHTPLTPTSVQTPTTFNPPSYFKRPNRTLTTEFNDPHRNVSVHVPSDSKITVDKSEKNMGVQPQQESLSQLRKIAREKTVASQPITEDATQNLPTSKSITFASSNKTIDQGSLKNQLKLEFGSLLGNEPKIEKKESNGQETPPENQLKEKIQQKKMAFAQLKKEALAVLTDIL